MNDNLYFIIFLFDKIQFRIVNHEKNITWFRVIRLLRHRNV